MRISAAPPKRASELSPHSSACKDSSPRETIFFLRALRAYAPWTPEAYKFECKSFRPQIAFGLELKKKKKATYCAMKHGNDIVRADGVASFAQSDRQRTSCAWSMGTIAPKLVLKKERRKRKIQMKIVTRGNQLPKSIHAQTILQIAFEKDMWQCKNAA